MTPRELDEARLARLLGASRAAANPAALARARARIASRAAAPGLALWLARPAVLAGAGALFVLCVTGAFVASQRPGASAPGTDPGLVTALLGEEDLGLPLGAAVAGEGAAGDSGEVMP